MKMHEKYDLVEMLNEIKEDEEMTGPEVKKVSQDEIMSMLKEKKKMGKSE